MNSSAKPTADLKFYIHKLLKVVVKDIFDRDKHPLNKDNPYFIDAFSSNHISNNYMIQLNSLLNVLGNKIAEKASFVANNPMKKSLKKSKKSLKIYKKNLGYKHIHTAVLLIIKGDLARHAVREGEKAVIKYTSVQKGSKDHPKSRTSRAGLVLSVSRVEKLIRDNHCGQVGITASVFLAAVLEYISAEILELSLKQKIEVYNWGRVSDRKKTLDTKMLMLAIKNDEEVNKLISNINWRLAG